MITKYFVISDVHSFYDPMMDALLSKGFDDQDPTHGIVICGDMFDRGPDSIKCYKFLQSLALPGRLVYIRGNHEDLLADCVHDLQKYRDIDRHHITNGTVKTIAQFSGYSEYELLCNCFNDDVFNTKMNEVLTFIDKESLNYYQLGDYVFVHGWVPCDSDDPVMYHARKKVTLTPEVEWSDIEKWEHARWLNGMMCWSQGAIPENKTIVCGHWHTSWGWAHLKHECSEWGTDAIFKPFEQDGIIAIDSCVAYTNQINCIVFEYDGNTWILK